MVTEAVEEGGGQLLIAEDLDPLGEREVGGDDRGAALVAVGDQVEEQFAAGPVGGDEAQLVDDQQGDAQVALVGARDGAVPADQDLGFEQLQEELLVVPAVVRGLADELSILSADSGQSQFSAVGVPRGRGA